MPLSSPRALVALAAALLLAGCAEEAPPPDPAAALVGVWEVTGEAGPFFNRNGQLYIFGDDGSLRITRSRPLGPASTINAAYDFIDDSTLQIRSEFDSENLVPALHGDTLLLRPLGTGDALMLVRSDAEPPPAPAPAPPDSVYSPPPDAPLDELPPARVPNS
jgi:hypothetical protein